MEPEIKRQTKVVLKPREISSSRLAFNAENIVTNVSFLFLEFI